MKKIQIAMVCLLAVAGMMMTGCKKEGEKVTLKAIIDTENDGKAYLNGDNFPVWESGDPIWVNGEQKSVTPSTSTPTNGTIADVESSNGYLAVYPYDENISNDGASVTVNIPRVQNFVSNGNNGQKVVPTMAAYTTGNTLFFKNLHSLIEVHVTNNTSSAFTIKRIVVNSSSKITGSATAAMTASDVTSLVMNSNSYNDATLEFGDEESQATIAANTNGVTFYVAVAPMSNCSTVTVTIYTTDSKYIGVQFTDVSLRRSRIAPVSITVSSAQPLKECGRFTINGNGQQVNFSPGNLQFYRALNNDGTLDDHWRFATQQYNYVGKGSPNGNVSNSNNKILKWMTRRNDPRYGKDHTSRGNWIDLFGWGTGSDPINFNTNKSSFTDWTSIGSGWYTLSIAEWSYILDSRTTNLRFLKATVNGVKGLILFPDGFAWPSHVIGSTTIYDKINIKDDGFTESITADQWTSLENKGAVFLPAGGYRTLRGGNNDGNIPSDEVGSISNSSTHGYYWARDAADNTNAYNLRIFGQGIVTTTAAEKKTGYSVRLVKNVQ